MLLDKANLDELKCNKYLMIVCGPMTDRDKAIVFRGSRIYNNNYEYVGQSHVELVCCHDVSYGVRQQYNLQGSTFVLSFRNGLLRDIRSDMVLFKDGNDFHRAIVDNFDIYVD